MVVAFRWVIFGCGLGYRERAECVGLPDAQGRCRDFRTPSTRAARVRRAAPPKAEVPRRVRGVAGSPSQAVLEVQHRSSARALPLSEVRRTMAV